MTMPGATNLPPLLLVLFALASFALNAWAILAKVIG